MHTAFCILWWLALWAGSVQMRRANGSDAAAKRAGKDAASRHRQAQARTGAIPDEHAAHEILPAHLHRRGTQEAANQSDSRMVTTRTSCADAAGYTAHRCLRHSQRRASMQHVVRARRVLGASSTYAHLVCVLLSQSIWPVLHQRGVVRAADLLCGGLGGRLQPEPHALRDLKARRRRTDGLPSIRIQQAQQRLEWRRVSAPATNDVLARTPTSALNTLTTGLEVNPCERLALLLHE